MYLPVAITSGGNNGVKEVKVKLNVFVSELAEPLC